MIGRTRATRFGWLVGWLSGSVMRNLAGLVVMLLAIGQSARSVDDPTRLVAGGLLALVVTGAWLLRNGPSVGLSTWLLGAASIALMLVLPGNGAVIGVVAALVNAGMRMPVRPGALAALVLGTGFLVVYAYVTRLDSLAGFAFTGMGLGFAYVATGSVREIRQQRERAEALLGELQRTRAAEIERAALAERTRIARDIHDVLAHTLSALAVQLEGTRLLVEQRPGDPAAVAAVERAHRLATEGLAEARRAVGALRGDRLPGPEGLARLVDEFSQATGTPGHFEVTGAPVALGSEAQLALYRAAQEALTNVRKHARATSVHVRLRYAPDGAELVVEDTAPATSEQQPISGGYGLVGMRERAELVGGTLEAGPLPTGFRVRVWLPTP